MRGPALKNGIIASQEVRTQSGAAGAARWSAQVARWGGDRRWHCAIYGPGPGGRWGHFTPASPWPTSRVSASAWDWEEGQISYQESGAKLICLEAASTRPRSGGNESDIIIWVTRRARRGVIVTITRGRCHPSQGDTHRLSGLKPQYL